MVRAAERLNHLGRRVVVVTNDQGADLVDTATARGRLGAVGEVTGGCFCCRFDDLVATTQRLVAQYKPDWLSPSRLVVALTLQLRCFVRYASSTERHLSSRP